MKTIQSFVFLILCAFQIQTVTLLPPKEFNRVLQTEKGVLIDIRTPGEFKKGHIKGALMLDFFSDNFEKELDKLDKKKTYFIYCGIGGRSEECGEMMAKKKFKKVYDLDGGINRWKAEALPIVF